MSLKLREFIKKIRACKTLDEERCLCNKESAQIRNLKKVKKNKKLTKQNLGPSATLCSSFPFQMYGNVFNGISNSIYSYDLFRFISKQ